MRTTLRFSSLDPVVRTTLNLPYCTVPDFYGGGAQALHMHVVYPVPEPAAPGYPVLLWICGGGWECCDPANRLHDLSYFAERGYIVCLAEYRVTGVAPFPAQIQDVKTALRFVRKHARAFRADPDRIALMGDSAGGHLVTLAGLTPGKAEFTGAQWAGVSEAVQAVINWYGVVDFAGMLAAYGAADASTMRPTDCLVKLFGAWPQSVPEQVDLATPLRYVSPEAPPFLILHGDRDATVPFAQSEALYEALERAGVPCELCTVEGADHATAEFSQAGLLRHIADWLDAALGKGRA